MPSDDEGGELNHFYDNGHMNGMVCMKEADEHVVRLRQNAWYGDNTAELQFPRKWDLKIVGNHFIPALSDAQIQDGIRMPIGSRPLSKLAAGKSKVAILLDDLSRPTPADQLLPDVLAELFAGGINPNDISIVIAGGTHVPASAHAGEKKTGRDLPSGVSVMAHDCRQALVDLGQTARGIPIRMNRQVIESDLKIGIGCVYPHQCAGFSGGSKILALGASGFETIQALHENMLGAQDRAGSIHNQFREEIEKIVDRVGLDFIVNVTLNQKREVAGVFAGDRVQAFNAGVDHAREVYAVETLPDADVAIVDMYPFDISFQVAYGRGLWPFELARKECSKILLAGCPEGMKTHDLFSASDRILDKVKHRITNLRMKHLRTLTARLRTLHKMYSMRKMRLYVLSSTLEEEKLRKALPNGKVVKHWEKLLARLISKHGENSKTTVAIYCCAPMMFPKKE